MFLLSMSGNPVISVFQTKREIEDALMKIFLTTNVRQEEIEVIELPDSAYEKFLQPKPERGSCALQ